MNPVVLNKMNPIVVLNIIALGYFAIGSILRVIYMYFNSDKDEDEDEDEDAEYGDNLFFSYSIMFFWPIVLSIYIIIAPFRLIFHCNEIILRKLLANKKLRKRRNEEIKKIMEEL